MVTTDDVRGKFLHASFVESTETTEPFDVAAAVDAFELWLQSERARIWEEGFAAGFDTCEDDLGAWAAIRSYGDDAEYEIINPYKEN